jgi:hypothetical protein
MKQLDKNAGPTSGLKKTTLITKLFNAVEKEETGEP